MLKKILTITIITSSLVALHGQTFKGLGYNHAIVQAIEKGELTNDKSEEDSIIFIAEFFEDFSNYKSWVFPKNKYWSDHYAFINSTYADSMISLGVATLDAFNSDGFPYTDDLGTIIPADTLTSNSFKFESVLPFDDTLFFSFFYQAGGKGDLPNEKDTLLLDFFHVDSMKWNNIFYTNDTEEPSKFKQVVIAIPESYIQNGFRFRFRNYISFENVDRNEGDPVFPIADLWHIDYIRIKTAATREDMYNLDDIMIANPLLSALTEYTATPYSHLQLALSTSERLIVPLSIRTSSPETDLIPVDRYYRTYDLTTGDLLRDPPSTSNDMEPNVFITFLDDLPSGPGFIQNEYDTIGRFKIVSYLGATDHNFKSENDTVERIETYHDYYAYDDGTAEYGIGISGQTEENIYMAIRFRTFIPDSLRAVLIYFNKTTTDPESSNNQEFQISIRKNSGSQPSDEVLYFSDYYFPAFNHGINEFTRIDIDPPIYVSDTFFVVIEQLGEYLNIGYDINTNNIKHYYEYHQPNWINRPNMMKGSFMIRPSFGTYSILTSEESINIDEVEICVFPNPVSDRLNFSLKALPGNPVGVAIYNLTGTCLINTTTENNYINVNSLPGGLYLIRITDIVNSKLYTAKFIKY
ncbi:MAG: T9SS type A sorting domain-containing protein [Bacteroidales bacterium]|nr:T9SS type A sorting domain-containing protein [Bacteroidales bacterium]